jgi:hypothetical protein
MSKFFRKIRKTLFSQSRFGRYLLYALGEIILVVIGILIALQINNWNEAKKIKAKELTYLSNIKTDLNISIEEMEKYTERCSSLIESGKRTLEHFNGKPVEDWNAFNRDIADVYTWQRFYLMDNTFQELMNSGNLAIISNDSIKAGLLDLDVMNKHLKYNEDHYRFDAEKTLYEPGYAMQDIDVMVKNYIYQLSNGAQGEAGMLNEEVFGPMLQDRKQKNGFAFAVLEFGGMIDKLEKMKLKCMEIVVSIDNEIYKYKNN